MSKEENSDLIKFLEPYPEDVQKNALLLRDFIWNLYPKCNELIYDNYNALVSGWSTTEKMGDTFCSVGVFPKHIHLGFYWGNEIPDPENMLLGKGKQYRYIIVTDMESIPKKYMIRLLKDAYNNSIAKLKLKNIQPQLKGITITKSESPVKKRPGIKPEKKTKK